MGNFKSHATQISKPVNSKRRRSILRGSVGPNGENLPTDLRLISTAFTQAGLLSTEASSEEVKRTIIRYAGTKGLRLNANQLQAVGAGIADPVIPRPRSLEQSRENMRVEFRLLRVKAEAVQANEFDF